MTIRDDIAHAIHHHIKVEFTIGDCLIIADRILSLLKERCKGIDATYKTYEENWEKLMAMLMEGK